MVQVARFVIMRVMICKSTFLKKIFFSFFCFFFRALSKGIKKPKKLFLRFFSFKKEEDSGSKERKLIDNFQHPQNSSGLCRKKLVIFADKVLLNSFQKNIRAFS